jgi:hypothetical protein
MKCTTCGNPTTNVISVERHVNGTVNRSRSKVIATCDRCKADLKASHERHERELAELRATLGITEVN